MPPPTHPPNSCHQPCSHLPTYSLSIFPPPPLPMLFIYHTLISFQLNILFNKTSAGTFYTGCDLATLR